MFKLKRDLLIWESRSPKRWMLNQWINASMDRSIFQPTNQLINQSINRSIDRTIEQSINRSINWTKQSASNYKRFKTNWVLWEPLHHVTAFCSQRRPIRIRDFLPENRLWQHQLHVGHEGQQRIARGHHFSFRLIPVKGIVSITDNLRQLSLREARLVKIDDTFLQACPSVFHGRHGQLAMLVNVKVDFQLKCAPWSGLQVGDLQCPQKTLRMKQNTSGSKKKTTNQSTTQSLNQSKTLSMRQSINQSINHLLTQSIDQRIKRLTAESPLHCRHT